MKLITVSLLALTAALASYSSKEEASPAAEFWQEATYVQAYFSEAPQAERSHAWLAKAWLEERPVSFSRG